MNNMMTTAMEGFSTATVGTATAFGLRPFRLVDAR